MRVSRLRFILPFLFLATACETDFDVAAPWEDITIVYALLDQNEPVQYIKLNKAFLGEGNALMMAAEPDSSYYPYSMEVKIEEWNETETTILRTIGFDTVSLYNKEEGVFPFPAHRMYKSLPYSHHFITSVGDTIWLNDKSIYKLIINNPVTGKEITARTQLIRNFTIIRPGFETEMSFKFDLNNTEIRKDFKWELPGNSGRNEFELIFRFREVDNATLDTINRAITISKTVINPSSSQQEIIYKILNREFYEACLNKIPYPDADQEERVKTRLHGFLDVVISVAAPELTNFINVYEPSMTIVQEKPVYTNIENGMGIFSARYQKMKTKKANAENLCFLNKYSLEVYKVNVDLKFFCNR